MGIDGFISRMRSGKNSLKTCRRQYEEELLKQMNPYYGWMLEKEKRTSGERDRGPKFSVFLYQTGYMSGEEVEFCKSSVRRQTYRRFEIMEGVNRFDREKASGDYLVFANAKGTLASGALGKLADMILSQGEDQPPYDLIYTDSDELDVAVGIDGTKEEGELRYRNNPWFKPDWSPDTFLSFCYFGELVCVRREIAALPELLAKKDFDIIYYDYLLKVTEQAEKIGHLPAVLFHRWGIDEGELIRDQDRYPVRDQKRYAEIKAAACARRGFDRIERQIVSEQPLVSVVIPSRDNYSVLRCCVESIRKNTAYKNYEILVVDNGSGNETVMDLKLLAATLDFQYIHEPMEFHYSRMNRLGAEKASGEYLLFLNDDVEASREDPDWMLNMVRAAALPHVGAVGVKLLYPDSVLIQHVGITNLDVGPSHKLMGYPDHDSYYFGRNSLNYNVLAVTGACLMIQRDKYEQAGGFDDAFPVGYGDVDLCVKMAERGLYNVVRNDVVLYHHESLSRGKDKMDPAKLDRLFTERELFYQRHPWLSGKDPFYSPNLIRDDIVYTPDYAPAWKDRSHFGAPCETDIQLPEPEKPDYFQYNIEAVELHYTESREREEYCLIEGWSCLTRAENCEFERYLVFLYNGKKCLVPAAGKYREDVGQVYRDVKDVKLAGFVCRVKTGELFRSLGVGPGVSGKPLVGRDIRIGILARRKTTGKNHYTGEIAVE